MSYPIFKFKLELWRAPVGLAVALTLAGCANPITTAEKLSQAGNYDAAFQELDKARKAHPEDSALMVAFTKQRDTTAAFLLYQASNAYAVGQVDEAKRLVDRMDELIPRDTRAASLRAMIERVPRHKRLLEQAQADYDNNRLDQAADVLRTIISEDPSNTRATSLLNRVDEKRETQTLSGASQLKTANKVINFEFRDAPLKTVFETMSRVAEVNFVFDKDVKADTKLTLFLRNTTVDEAMKLILSTQQLERKLLNDNSVLIYPNNTQKLKEQQDLVMRSYYLINADAKQAQNMIRTMLKSRDTFVDERLNMLVVRDTPEVLRLIDKLIESLDLVEPEVMLEVEVLEVSSSTVRELGLNLPNTVDYGIPGYAGPITRGDQLLVNVANPLIRARLNGTSGSSNLLANPKIRARNHEKAKVQIGEKLPVFTSTSTANVGVTTSVSYLDVGLKFEVEPSIQLDGDVVMKVALEVSNLNSQTAGPNGSIAYRVGTRVTTTALRLRDGETQVLAGLINDDDRRSASGVPGLSELPIVGSLFGVRTASHDKSEIVLLITPRIVRTTKLPALSGAAIAAGTEVLPGAPSPRMQSVKAQVSGQMGGGDGGGLSVMTESRESTPVQSEVKLSGPTEASAGSTLTVMVFNPSDVPVNTELNFDAGVFSAKGGSAQPGTLVVTVPPRANWPVQLQVNSRSSESTSTIVVKPGNGAIAVRIRVTGDAAANSLSTTAP